MPAGNTGQGNVPNSLIHYGQRYYDPTTGRWTQQDPEDRMTSASQADRFLFTSGDPINNSDPSGRSATDYIKACGEGAAFGYIGEGAAGAAKGCAFGVAEQFSKEEGCETCAEALEVVDRATNAAEIAENGVEGIEEGVEEL